MCVALIIMARVIVNCEKPGTEHLLNSKKFMNDALIYISSIRLGKVQQKILETKLTQFGGSVVKKAKLQKKPHVHMC